MSSLSILIIEGDSSVSRLFEDFFDLYQYQTDICNDGQAALQAILGHAHYDLILVSYRVPGTDGIELVRFIKTLEQRKRIPVLMVTGSVDVDEQASRAGVDQVLHKPLDLRILISTVHRLAGLPPRPDYDR